MEIILVLVVLVVIAKIFGVSNFVLVSCGLGLIELIIFAMLLFFIGFTVLLLFSKRRTAAFSRIGKPEGKRFSVAYYVMDGTEYPCVFPKESVSYGKMYESGKQYTVFYSKLLKKVYDRWAVMTCVVGLVFSIFAVVFTLRLLTWLANM